MKEVNASALDEFLGNKASVPVPVSTEATPPTPQPLGGNVLTELNQGTSNLNSTMGQAVELIKGINDLISNGSSLFLRGAERKEQRIENGGFADNNSGNYQEYVKQQMQPKKTPRDDFKIDKSSLEVSSTQGASRVHEWITHTVENAPEGMTLFDFKEEWNKNKREFIEIMSRIYKNDTKWLQELNANIADKAPSSPVKKKPNTTPTTSKNAEQVAPKERESLEEKQDTKAVSTNGSSKKSKSKT